MARAKAGRKPTERKLNDKQLRFIAFYKGDAKEAALAAGYSPKSAGRLGMKLRQTPAIARAIQKNMDAEASLAKADRDEVLRTLTGIMRDEGTHAAQRIKAISEYSKIMGWQIHKVEDVTPDRFLRQKSDEELRELAAATAQELDQLTCVPAPGQHLQ
jgi:phage terminase small subunit